MPVAGLMNLFPYKADEASSGLQKGLWAQLRSRYITLTIQPANRSSCLCEPFHHEKAARELLT